MKKTEEYRETLRHLTEWDSFLLAESGLPGPRGNLELAQAVADEGDEATFLRYLAFDAERAPTNTPQEFLAFCGVVGLGRLVAEGHKEYLATLRRCASDPRWRTREAVAMALQRLGDADMDGLLHEMESWSRGTALEQRAAAAALCEPRLLRNKEQVAHVLRILDEITASIRQAGDRKGAEFQALRKGLAYCWSVAVAALPEEGKAAMERWFASDDKDVRWIMAENLKKKRLARMDGAWVDAAQERLASTGPKRRPPA
jgi:hypothetical protein